MDVPKSIPVYLDRFMVEGHALLSLWGGGKGVITMTPSAVSEPTREKVLKVVNDAGFGCESILEADVCVYAVYVSGIEGRSKGAVSVLADEFSFTVDELVNSERGVTKEGVYNG